MYLVLSAFPNFGKGKGKFHPRTGQGGPKGEYTHSCTISLTLMLDGGWRSAPRLGRFTVVNDSVPIVLGAGCASGPVGTDAKNLAPTGIRSSDRPTRS
jgi:hypothetical protein